MLGGYVVACCHSHAPFSTSSKRPSQRRTIHRAVQFRIALRCIRPKQCIGHSACVQATRTNSGIHRPDREGIKEAEKLFGLRGRRAATVHILRDCRNIPRERDYEDGTVDKLGLIAKWPVTVYIRYPEDAFERMRPENQSCLFDYLSLSLSIAPVSCR